jgi:hypothetical protein
MKPTADMIPMPPGLAPQSAAAGTVSLSRPEIPRSVVLVGDGIPEVDLEEGMDRLAVAESSGDKRGSIATAASQLLLIAAAAAVIWWLLPRGIAARPPLELPPALQEEPVPLAPAHRAAEEAAIRLLERAAPSRALAAFRECVDSGAASVGLWRYYLQTLVELDERPELRHRAGQFLALHPDRLEAAHFQAEAVRRDDIESRRERGRGWAAIWKAARTLGSPAPIAPAYLAEIAACQGKLDDALALLQRQEAAWSAARRTPWADLLLLDRARLHHHAWRCGGHGFADPHRELALEALRQMSSTTGADAVSLRLDIYRRCFESWPTRIGYAAGPQVVDGVACSREQVQQAIRSMRDTLERLPPTGRR